MDLTNPHFQNHRIQYVPRFADENLGDHVIPNPEDNYRIYIFYVTLDNMIAEMKARCTGLEKVAQLFGFLRPNRLQQMSLEEITPHAQRLMEVHEQFVFGNQLLQQVLLQQ